jgi:DNA-binding NtrC family response regulator
MSAVRTGIRQTLSLILLRYGFSAILAASVQQALEQLYAHEFDLLLCDLNIEDGYKVVQATRKLHPNCINIILTGYPGIESAVNGYGKALTIILLNPQTQMLLSRCLQRN